MTQFSFCDYELMLGASKFWIVDVTEADSEKHYQLVCDCLEYNRGISFLHARRLSSLSMVMRSRNGVLMPGNLVLMRSLFIVPGPAWDHC